MSELEFDIRSCPNASWDEPQELSLRLGDNCFTELVRSASNACDEYLNVPPVHLAFWIIDNWWRLRWEPIVTESPGPDWQMAHELSAIGGGYFWPRLRFWGEDFRVGVENKIDSPMGDIGLSFTNETGKKYIGAEQFETSVDDFLKRSLDACTCEKKALQELHSALVEERADMNHSSWRRLEAKLGFDVDDAPDGLIEWLLELARIYGHDGIEEAVVACQGKKAAELLESAIRTTRQSCIMIGTGEAIQIVGDIPRNAHQPVYEVAGKAAVNLRHYMGVNEGRLDNKRLSEFLGITKRQIDSREPVTEGPAYGLRLRQDDGTSAISLHARRSIARRFELCRGLGDAIWSGNDGLGVISCTMTARQQFQCAFTQYMLCPYEGLLAYVNSETPAEDDFVAAADHFHVSEKDVRTVWKRGRSNPM